MSLLPLSQFRVRPQALFTLIIVSSFILFIICLYLYSQFDFNNYGIKLCFNILYYGYNYINSRLFNILGFTWYVLSLNWGIGGVESYDMPTLIILIAFLLDLHILLILIFFFMPCLLLIKKLIIIFNLKELKREESYLNYKYINKIRNFLFSRNLIEKIIKYCYFFVLILIILILLDLYIIKQNMFQYILNFNILTGKYLLNNENLYYFNFINSDIFSAFEIFINYIIIIHLIILFFLIYYIYRYNNSHSNFQILYFFRLINKNRTDKSIKINNNFFNIHIYYNIYVILFILFIIIILTIFSFIFINYIFDNMEILVDQYTYAHIEVSDDPKEKIF